MLNECYFYFSRDQDLPDADKKFLELPALERTGFLPPGLFTRAVCEFVMHQQLTGGSRPDLSRQTMLVTIGAVEVRLDVVPHMFAIRMQTTTPTALPIVRRTSDIFAAILASTFPSVFMFVLLPYSDTVLLDLAVITQCTANKDSLMVLRRLVDIPQLYDPFLFYPGLRKRGHQVFISYRQIANGMVVDTLVDAMYREMSRVSGTEIDVFYDQTSLLLGRPFVVDFCTGLSTSLVAVPVVSVQAMERFTRQGSAAGPDYMLVEWLLMLELAAEGRVRRILPLVLGDQFANPDCAASASAEPICDIGKLVAWVQAKVPDATCPHTERVLVEMRALLGMPARPVPTTRAVVLQLMRYNVMPLCTAQAAVARWAGSAKVHGAPATSGSTLGGWTALTQTGETIRSVVDEELAKAKPAARGPQAREAVTDSVRAAIAPTGPGMSGPAAAAASRGASSSPSPSLPAAANPTAASPAFGGDRAALAALLASKGVSVKDPGSLDILVREELDSAAMLADVSTDNLRAVGIPMGLCIAIKKAFPG